MTIRPIGHSLGIAPASIVSLYKLWCSLDAGVDNAAWSVAIFKLLVADDDASMTYEQSRLPTVTRPNASSGNSVAPKSYPLFLLTLSRPYL
jgi:hypothetical protein